MKKIKKSVLGVMSGTSLDGIDIVIVHFNYERHWTFRLEVATTIPYPTDWIDHLQNAAKCSPSAIRELDKKYTKHLANQINCFLKDHSSIKIDFISSHGHTVLHQPAKKITYQMGNLPELAILTNHPVICDFRKANVALGGQGAPLVPGGEGYLFPFYDVFVNLGGFSNISVHEGKSIQAYDICAVNVVLNTLANRLGFAFDKGGNIARGGTLIPQLFLQLETLDFYQLKPPKSLGIEWVQEKINPLLNVFKKEHVSDLLFTYTQHIAKQIASHLPKNRKVLFSGGGCYNDFLMDTIGQYAQSEIILPSPEIIEFKEAIIFAFLGVLRDQDLPNCLASVTGSPKDHCGGNIFFPSKP